jgi:hypothetical protein
LRVSVMQGMRLSRLEQADPLVVSKEHEHGRPVSSCNPWLWRLGFSGTAWHASE